MQLDVPTEKMSKFIHLSWGLFFFLQIITGIMMFSSYIIVYYCGVTRMIKFTCYVIVYC